MVKIIKEKELNIKGAIKKVIRINHKSEFLNVLTNCWRGKEFSSIYWRGLVLENGFIRENGDVDDSFLVGKNLLYYEIPDVVCLNLGLDLSNVDLSKVNNEIDLHYTKSDFYNNTDSLCDVVLSELEKKSIDDDINKTMMEFQSEMWKQIQATQVPWEELCIGKTVDEAINIVTAWDAQQVLIENHLDKKAEEATRRAVCDQKVAEAEQVIVEYEAIRKVSEKVAEAEQVIAEYEAVQKVSEKK